MRTRAGVAIAVVSIGLWAVCAGAAVLTPLEVHQNLNLRAVSGVAVSPDGSNVYAVAEFGDTLAVYDRNLDGSLDVVSVLRDGVGGMEDLDGASAVTVSPDGAHVYVGSSGDNAIVVFDRNPLTGTLAHVQSLHDTVIPFSPRRLVVSSDGAFLYAACLGQDLLVYARDALTGMLTFVQHEATLGNPRTLALSPDGANLYAANTFGIGIYDRDPVTGEITLVGSPDVSPGANAIVVSPDGTNVYAANAIGVTSYARGPGGALTWFAGGYSTGGGGGAAIAIDASGSHLYVPSEISDALHVVSRDPGTGVLAPLEVFTDGVAGVDGLARGLDVALAPGDASVYVAGADDAAIAAFDRDGLDGTLSFIEADEDAVAGEPVVGPCRAIVAADGLHVYVATQSSPALFAFCDQVTVFSRDLLDGSLQFEFNQLSGVDHRDLLLTPDGAHLYVARFSPDQLEVYGRNPGTGALAALATYPGPDMCVLSVSPDGQHLYGTPCSGPGTQVFERDPATGLLTAGPTTTQVGSLQFSSDGLYAYEEGGDGFDVYSRDPSTGLLTFVTRVDGNDSQFDGTLDGPVAVAISADDRHVYAFSTGGGFNPPEALHAFQRDPITGLLKLVRTVSDFAAFVSNVAAPDQLVITPDGSYVFVLPDSETGIVAFVRDPGTGKARPIETLEDDQNGVHGIERVHGAIDPDGIALYTISRLDDALVVFSIDPCGTAALPKLTLTRIGSDPVAGDDGLKLKAETKLRQGTFASLDPITSGAHLVVTAADGTPRLDVAIPAGAFGGSGTAGWKLNGAGTAWSFTDTTASPAGGIKKVKIVDRGLVLPDTIRIVVTGKNGAYPVVAGDEPLEARLELGSSALCSASQFVEGDCGFNGIGSKLACKGR